jgi:hypothetical protein
MGCTTVDDEKGKNGGNAVTNGSDNYKVYNTTETLKTVECSGQSRTYRVGPGETVSMTCRDVAMPLNPNACTLIEVNARYAGQAKCQHKWFGDDAKLIEGDKLKCTTTC